jgi:hypothetical protein
VHDKPTQRELLVTNITRCVAEAAKHDRCVVNSGIKYVGTAFTGNRVSLKPSFSTPCQGVNTLRVREKQ